MSSISVFYNKIILQKYPAEIFQDTKSVWKISSSTCRSPLYDDALLSDFMLILILVEETLCRITSMSLGRHNEKRTNNEYQMSYGLADY